MPGLLTFMQNPPPITVSGQNSASAYQLTLQSANLKEIYDVDAAAGGRRCAQLPGFVDVNTDMQISSPQVMVDIDRDRALALGVTPQQMQDALFSAYSARQVSVIYAPANQYAGDPGSGARSTSARPDALSKLYLRSSAGALVPLDSVVRTQRHDGPADHQSLRAIAGGDRSRSTCARVSRWAQAAQQVDDAVRELRMPATISAQLPGHGEGVPELVPEPVGAADRGDPGDLHRAGHSV